MKLLDREGLHAKGITYSDVQLWRLEKAGKFPKKIKLGGESSRSFWNEIEVDAYIASKIAKRDAEAA